MSYWYHDAATMIFVGEITAIDTEAEMITLNERDGSARIQLRYPAGAKKTLMAAFQKKLTLRFILPLDEMASCEEEGKFFGAIPSWSKQKDEEEKERRKKLCKKARRKVAAR